MKVIVVNNISKGESIPDGGIVFWSGNASELPDEWTIYDSANDAFIMGTDLVGINTTKQGSNSHYHTVKNTNKKGAHSHTASVLGNFQNDQITNNLLTTTSGTEVIGYHTHPLGDPSVTSIESSGSHDHTIDDTYSSDYIPTYKRYYLIKSNGNAELPIGSIALWPNSAASIPLGWRLCDGSLYEGKYLPDIRSRFMYVPNVDEDVGLSGGNNSHNHTAKTKVNEDGNHRHYMHLDSLDYPPSGTKYYVNPSSGTISLARYSHFHSFNTHFSLYSGSHTHTISGGLKSVEILPPYIKLYFIVRVY